MPEATLLLGYTKSSPIGQHCPSSLIWSAESTPVDILDSAKKRGERASEKMREEDRETWIPYVLPKLSPSSRSRAAKGTYIIHPTIPRSRSTNVSRGTSLNYRNVSPISLPSDGAHRRELLISTTGNLQNYFPT